ncbi:winged helix-turn-helix transcriptional regulator [Candidatus Saccharibacteria bacterium]|nr:winged helix-turn-helix transcriptional regulator [Candidatus Saccharibacteria bacterium]
MNSYSTHTPTTSIDNLSALLKLLADPTRLKILLTLHKNEHCVSDCMCHLPGVSQSLLSHHLADLRKAGLVEANKQGLKVYYSLSNRGQEILSALTNLNKGEESMSTCSCQKCVCQNCAC